MGLTRKIVALAQPLSEIDAALLHESCRAQVRQAQNSVFEDYLFAVVRTKFSNSASRVFLFGEGLCYLARQFPKALCDRVIATEPSKEAVAYVQQKKLLQESKIPLYEWCLEALPLGIQMHLSDSRPSVVAGLNVLGCISPSSQKNAVAQIFKMQPEGGLFVHFFDIFPGLYFQALKDKYGDSELAPARDNDKNFLLWRIPKTWIAKQSGFVARSCEDLSQLLYEPNRVCESLKFWQSACPEGEKIDPLSELNKDVRSAVKEAGYTIIHCKIETRSTAVNHGTKGKTSWELGALLHTPSEKENSGVQSVKMHILVAQKQKPKSSSSPAPSTKS